MSRVTNGEVPTNLKDNFLDAQLFSVQVVDEYFVDNIEYLSTGFAPQDFITVCRLSTYCRTFIQNGYI
jgi:hypothetical protein